MYRVRVRIRGGSGSATDKTRGTYCACSIRPCRSRRLCRSLQPLADCRTITVRVAGISTDDLTACLIETDMSKVVDRAYVVLSNLTSGVTGDDATNATISVTMNGDKTLVADFNPDEWLYDPATQTISGREWTSGKVALDAGLEGAPRGGRPGERRVDAASERHVGHLRNRRGQAVLSRPSPERI